MIDDWRAQNPNPRLQMLPCVSLLTQAPSPHADRFLPIQGQLAYPDTPVFWRRSRPLDGENRPLFTHGIARQRCQILHRRLRGERKNMEAVGLHFSIAGFFEISQWLHFAAALRRICGLNRDTMGRSDKEGGEKLKAIQSDDRIINGPGCVVSRRMHIHKGAVQMAQCCPMWSSRFWKQLPTCIVVALYNLPISLQGLRRRLLVPRVL